MIENEKKSNIDWPAHYDIIRILGAKKFRQDHKFCESTKKSEIIAKTTPVLAIFKEISKKRKCSIARRIMTS